MATTRPQAARAVALAADRDASVAARGSGRFAAQAPLHIFLLAARRSCGSCRPSACC